MQNASDLLDEEDFKKLRLLWNAGKKHEVASKLAFWKDRKKTRVAELLYEFWVRAIFRSEQSKAWRKFEIDVMETFKQGGWNVKPSPIVDFIATKNGISYAVECKRSSQREKIFEGIGQLLYYRWVTGDADSKLILVVLEVKDKAYLEFAQSFGIDIRSKEDIAKEYSTQRKEQIISLASILEREGVPHKKIASKLAKLTPYDETYILKLLPAKYKQEEKRKAGKISAEKRTKGKLIWGSQTTLTEI